MAQRLCTSVLTPAQQHNDEQWLTDSFQDNKQLKNGLNSFLTFFYASLALMAAGRHYNNNNHKRNVSASKMSKKQKCTRVSDT